MKSEATLRTASTPSEKKPILGAGRELHGVPVALILSLISRNSAAGWRPRAGLRLPPRRARGHDWRCASAVVRKTGMPKDVASRRISPRRVTTPSCAPRLDACCCRMRRSSGCNATCTCGGHTSRILGDFAHDMRSRTETRSSWVARVMICVFIRPNYNGRARCPHRVPSAACNLGDALACADAVIMSIMLNPSMAFCSRAPASDGRPGVEASGS